MTPHQELKGELVRVEGMGSGLKLGLSFVVSSWDENLGPCLELHSSGRGAGVEVVGGESALKGRRSRLRNGTTETPLTTHSCCHDCLATRR